MTSAWGQVEYLIGDPSAEEQLMLEFINRARAAPAAEGVMLGAETNIYAIGDNDYWGVDLALMEAEMAGLPVAGPLAFNSNLLDSTHGHSLDMFNDGFQGHEGSGSPGSTIGQRANAAGYTGWTEVLETVYSYMKTIEHGHASFEVDWGDGDGNMQTGRPHRVVLHDTTLREIGIGIVDGTNGDYGPKFVTQDLGIRPAFTTFITGVIYYDLDSDGFYDIGEGIGGAQINVAGGAYYGISSPSGGYSVPVAGNGSYSVTIDLPGTVSHTATVTVAGGQNTKLDWTPPYTGMALDGPEYVSVDVATGFAISELAGAEGYEVKMITEEFEPLEEDAENGSSGMTIVKNGSYNVLQSSVRNSGSRAFHLAHNSVGVRDQTVTFEREFVPGAFASMSFWSRMRFTEEGQWALVQVSRNGGLTWEDVWDQRGDFDIVESSFSEKTVSLSAYEGQTIKIRFNYASLAGGQSIGTGNSYGWFFDDISFLDMVELVDPVVTSVGKVAPVFSYTATTTGPRMAYVRALTQGGALKWEQALQITALGNDYVGWTVRREELSGLDEGALLDVSGDYDNDGYNQAYEYVLEGLGYDPASGDGGVLPAPAEVGGYIVMDYQIDTGKADVVLEVLASTDMTNWFGPSDVGRPAGFEDILLSSGPGTIEERRARVPATTDEIFFRFDATVIEGGE